MGWSWRRAGSGGISGATIGWGLGGPIGAVVGGVLGTTFGGLLGGSGSDAAMLQDPRSADYLKSTAHYGSTIPVLLCGTRRVVLQVVARGHVQIDGTFNADVPRLYGASQWSIYDLVLAGVEGVGVSVGSLEIDDYAYSEVRYREAGLYWNPGQLTSDPRVVTIANDGVGGLWQVENHGLACFIAKHFSGAVLDGNFVDLFSLYRYGPRNPNGGDFFSVFPEQINSSPRYVATLSANVAPGNQDGLPEIAISNVLTQSALWGAGWPSSRFDAYTGTDGAAQSGFAAYCAARGWTLSWLIDSQLSAADAITQIASACDSELVESGGRLRVLPRGEFVVGGFLPDAQPVCNLGYSDFVSASGEQFGENEDPVSIAVAPDASVFNVCPVTFRDRSLKDEENTVSVPETSDVNEPLAGGQVRGERAAPAVSLPCIANAAHAKAISASVARRAVWQRARYTFHLPWRFSFLEPMDIVRFDDSVGGFALRPVRILRVDDSVMGDAVVLGITAEDYLGDLAAGVKVDMSPAA